MKLNFTPAITVCALLTACPAPDDQDTASGATETTQPTSSSTAPTGTEPTTGTSAEPTTTESTGEPPNPGATRVVYIPYVMMGNSEQAVAVRSVEIADGVAAPPETMIEAPAGSWLEYAELPVAGDLVFPVHTGFEGPAQLWLIDLATSTSHPVALPPGVARVHDAHVSRDRSHLIVQAGPEVSHKTSTFYLCELTGVACTLAPLDFGLPPMTYISKVVDVSQSGGWILHERRPDDASNVEVRLAKFDDPTSSAAIASFIKTMSPVTVFAPDSKAIYLIESNTAQSLAVDISSFPPGPAVPMHPGLPGMFAHVELTWAPDMSAALVWSGNGNRGQLHRITVDGATIGAPVPFNTGGPEHVFKEHLAVTADGQRALFLSDHESQFDEQLYLADNAAPEALPVRVNAPLAENTKVSEAFVLPDPAHAVYMAGAMLKLFHASLDPVGEVVQLDAADHSVTPFCLLPTPDGQRIIYSATSADPDRALFLVDIGGPQPTPPVDLTTALPGGVQVHSDCSLTPDAEQVLFVGRDADGPAGLYMTTIAPEVGQAVELSTPGDIVRAFVAL